MMIRLFLIAALLGTACKHDPAKPSEGERTTPALRLAPEDIVTVQRGEILTGPRISGTLAPSIRAVVRAETAGAVMAIGPELGDAVKKGDLLARIEAKALGDVTSSAQSGVTSAQAQADLARREVQRTEALVKGGALSQRELDRARSQLTAAEAAVTQARAQLSSSRSQLGDATARSPLTGVVAKRSVSVGDVVAPGAELYEIIDPATMRLDASIASDDLSAIAPGKTVDFDVRGYPGQKFTGRISRIAPAADPVTRHIQVLVEIPNPGNRLVAGLYAEGRVAVEKREALVAPLAAIDTSGDQPSVLRVKNGVLERSVIAIGIRDERAETVEVTSALSAGDVLLAARAGRNVVPGIKVELPTATAGAGSSGAPARAGSAAARPDSGTPAASAAPGSAAPSAAPVEKR